jgi:hypothetical protein
VRENGIAMPAGQKGNRMASDLLTVEAAAEYLGLGITTLNKWRVSGAGPVFVKMGSRIAYTRSDLERFIAQNRLRSTSARAKGVAA